MKGSQTLHVSPCVSFKIDKSCLKTSKLISFYLPIAKENILLLSADCQNAGLKALHSLTDAFLFTLYIQLHLIKFRKGT